jgi:hypothetical protein
MRPFVILLVLSISGIAASHVNAQSSGGAFAITRSVVAPASSSSGGAFSMTATVGQPTVDNSSAGAFQVKSGYAAIAPSDVIFANGFEP